MTRKTIFDREQSSDAGARINTGAMPESAARFFTLKTLDHGIKEAPNRGATDFYSGLGKIELDMLSQYAETQCVNEANESMTLTRLQLDNDSAEYKSNNPDGKGYAEFRTARFEELMNGAVNNASTPRTKEILQGYYGTAAGDIYKTSIDEEINIRKNNAVEVANQNFEIQNQKVLHTPTLRNSLLLERQTLLNSMKPILGTDYNKYEKTHMATFEISAVRGMIDLNPHAADKYLSTPNKYLTADAVNSLRNESDTEKRRIQSKQLMDLKIVDKIAARAYSNYVSDIKSAERTGQVGEAEKLMARAKTDGNLPKHKYKELEFWLQDYRGELSKISDQEGNIKRCKLTGEQLSTKVTPSTLANYRQNDVETENMRRLQAGEAPKTFTDQVQDIKDYPNVFKYADAPLQTQMINALRTAKGEALRDAATAIMEEPKGVKALDGISQDNVALAYAINITVAADGHDRNAHMIRDKWIEYTPKEVRDYRKKIIEEDKKEGSYFFEDNIDKRIFKPIKEMAGMEKADLKDFRIRESVLGLYETTYMNTGDKNLALRTAAEYCKVRYRKTNVNGNENEIMIDPPTEQNTAMSKIDINQSVSCELDSLMTRIEKHKDQYLGNYAVRKSQSKPFLKNGRYVTRAFKTTPQQREIEAFINGQWERRQLFIESNGAGAYTAYFMPYQDEPFWSVSDFSKSGNAAKEYLQDPENAFVGNSFKLEANKWTEKQNLPSSKEKKQNLPSSKEKKLQLQKSIADRKKKLGMT